MELIDNSCLQIGVLALQGDVQEHINTVEALGHRGLAVKYQEQLEALDGIIIPGGESTTINRLTEARAHGLFQELKQRAQSGLPVYGTCMGSIMLAKNLEGSSQETLALMDIKVRRNAYGSQAKSFETDLNIKGLEGEPFPAIFIRAPAIIEAASGVEVLSAMGDSIVAARQDHFLATTFHPELTGDSRIHQLFLNMVVDSKRASNERALIVDPCHETGNLAV